MGEAWAWGRRRCERGEVLRMRADGWVRLTEEEARKPSIGIWSQEEVCELVMFVVDNGYIRRGKTILRQVRGFGMGLACARQNANLGCYPVERDYAAKKGADVCRA